MRYSNIRFIEGKTCAVCGSQLVDTESSIMTWQMKGHGNVTDYGHLIKACEKRLAEINENV